jgi:hypothetical protein
VEIATGQGLTGSPLTLYRWANRDVTDEERLVRNLEGFQYIDVNGNVIGTLNPDRNYRAVMAVLSKNFSNRWQAQASYVWSKATGNVRNDTLESWTTRYLTPSLALVNAEGRMENDRTHEFKLFGNYQIPVIELSVGAYYRALSGRTYTPIINVSGSTLSYPGTISPRLESRGSRRYPSQQTVDLRLEKRFNFDVHRVGVFLDIANVFNNDTILERQTRYPSRDISGSTVLFDAPTSIEDPRQLTVGVRWTF